MTDNPTNRRELIDSIDALDATVENLRQNLNLVASVNETNSIMVHSNRKWITYTIIGLILDIMLTFSFMFLYRRVNNNAHSIEKTQQIVSTDVLCPLYKLFIDSYHPELQPENERQKYIDAFLVINQGNKALGCNNG